MAKLQGTQRWRDFSAAIVQKVASEITLPNSIPFGLNMIYDDILGKAVRRPGTATQLSQPDAGESATGLFQHIDSTHANSVLFVKYLTTIYNGVSGASSLASLTSASKARFATFLNNTLMSTGDEIRSYDNAGGWISTGGVFDLANAPANGKFPIEFKDRMYLFTDDEAHFTTTPNNSGNLSWINDGSGSRQIEQEDGGGLLTGVNKVPGYLLMYKERSLKRWNFNSSFPESLMNIGTYSHESVVASRGQNFFYSYNAKGFFKTAGGYPKRISRQIEAFCEAMSAAQAQGMQGWGDERHIYWAISGGITVELSRGYTETHTNVVFRYSIDADHWAVLSYPFPLTSMGRYLDSSKDEFTVFSDDDGNVLTLNSGNSDYNGLDITWIIQAPEIDFNFRHRRKSISGKIFAHTDFAEGALLQCRTDYGEWQEIGHIKKDIVSEIKLKKPLVGHLFEFRLADKSQDEPAVIRGLDFTNVEVYEA